MDVRARRSCGAFRRTLRNGEKVKSRSGSFVPPPPRVVLFSTSPSASALRPWFGFRFCAGLGSLRCFLRNFSFRFSVGLGLRFSLKKSQTNFGVIQTSRKTPVWLLPFSRCRPKPCRDLGLASASLPVFPYFSVLLLFPYFWFRLSRPKPVVWVRIQTSGTSRPKPCHAFRTTHIAHNTHHARCTLRTVHTTCSMHSAQHTKHAKYAPRTIRT